MVKKSITRVELEKKIDEFRPQAKEIATKAVDEIERFLVGLGDDGFTAEEKEQHIEGNLDIFVTQFRELLEEEFEVIDD